jgi:hypothetical protein
LAIWQAVNPVIFAAKAVSIRIAQASLYHVKFDLAGNAAKSVEM